MKAVSALGILTVLVCLLAGCGGGGGGSTPTQTGTNGVILRDMVVLGYNDLGMHCMNQDFSEMMILPPYNTLHAQVIRRGEEPQIVTSGVTVSYSIPGNTSSSDKTNFWTYSAQLTGSPIPPNIGLTGNGLSGTMTPTGDNDWSAIGIPLTQITDSNQDNPYQLAKITITNGATVSAQTMAVTPVSWEISCNLCHNKTPGISTATDILRAHDRLHGTNLEASKPVRCGSCHAQVPLGALGLGAAGDESLSLAMHKAHAPRMSAVNLDVECYACHPGVKTKCLRDVHFSAGMTCLDCHGDMTQVAQPSRRPWLDEPRCGTCHPRNPQAAGFQLEQAGTLYRNSKGHHGVHCEACHGSTHAITPSVVGADNVQAIGAQGHAGKIDTCSVCHINRPDDSFGHSLSGGGN